MIYSDAKIIIVDDVQEHLDKLALPFWKAGVACKCYKYDSTYSNPLNNVRVAFFDININPSGGGSSSQRMNDVAIAIKKYIANDNGPFVLIFWTSNKNMVNDIKEYINIRHKDCPQPIHVDSIDKDEFLDDETELLSTLQELMDDETLKVIYNFERSSMMAASKTIDQFCRLVPKSDAWGVNEDFKLNFEKTLSWVAVKNMGFEYAKDNPGKGIASSLLPILNYHAERLQDLEIWRTYLSSLQSALKQSDIICPEGFSESKINSIFHIDATDGQKNVRGSVIEIDKGNKKVLSTLNIMNIDAWFNYIIPFNSNKNSSKRATRKDSKLIAVEMSAACDFSNKKDRINKYILGFLTPVINVDSDIDNIRRPDSSFHIGGVNFHFGEKDYQIWLNLNYVFGAIPEDKRLGTPLFVLKKEIMDMIGHKYASHVSRIGITSF